MARKQRSATAVEEPQPTDQALPARSGRVWLQRIIAEYTQNMSREDFDPEEWAENPAGLAEKALQCLDDGDADQALSWAMSAAALTSGLDFIRPQETVLLTRFKQMAATAKWRQTREQEKRDAAARYLALLDANPKMKKTAALAKAVANTSIKARTLRAYMSQRGKV